MKRALAIAAGVLVLGTLVFLGVRKGGQQKGTVVYAEPVTARPLSEIVKASGEIDPRVKVNISAHVIGKIQKMYAVEGQPIAAGQPFLELEKEAFLAQREQWAAQLSSSQTAAHRAEVTLADARNKLARARKLSQDDLISREQLESAELQETSSRLALDEARQAIRQAQANLDNAKDELVKTTIYAPLSGTVIRLNAEEGEVVVSGTMNNAGSVIGTIADLSEILARVDVDENEIVKVQIGQSATLHVDALPRRTWHGKVVEVGSSGSERPQQPDVTFFAVKILLEAPDPALRPGMSVRAQIHTAERPRALTVPLQSVVERPAKAVQPGADAGEAAEEVKVVYIIEHGRAVERPVQTGISDDTRVEILSGARAGESVVTGPYRTLRDLEAGELVKVEAPPREGREERKRARDRKKDAEE
jgi:HlyD family secretion protein